MFSTSRAAPSLSCLHRHHALQPTTTPKVFRRSTQSQSRRHVRKKPTTSAAKTKKRLERREERDYTGQKTMFDREFYINLKKAKQQMREDWELGPLKPWREGLASSTTLDPIDPEDNTRERNLFDPKYSTYGTLSIRQKTEYPTIPPHRRLRDWFFRVGDRVCLVEGREGEKGKIGTIDEIDEATGRVTVQGINIVEFRRPAYMIGKGEQKYETSELPVPFRHLRLVYPIMDPATNEYRDCIINNLELRNRRRDPLRAFDPKAQWTFDRYLMPQNVRIPWPDEYTPEPEATSFSYDTLRLEVEEKTFHPVLLMPPMPEGVYEPLQQKEDQYAKRTKWYPSGLPGDTNDDYEVDELDIRGERARKKTELIDQWDKELDKQYREELAEEEEGGGKGRGRRSQKSEGLPRNDSKALKQSLKARGAKNLARGGRSANGNFMESKELPEFDQDALQTIARHMQAAREKKGQDSRDFIPPSAPAAAASASDEPRIDP